MRIRKIKKNIKEGLLQYKTNNHLNTLDIFE